MYHVTPKLNADCRMINRWMERSIFNPAIARAMTVIVISWASIWITYAMHCT